jgi:hypothetical protein
MNCSTSKVLNLLRSALCAFVVCVSFVYVNAQNREFDAYINSSTSFEGGIGGDCWESGDEEYTVNAYIWDNLDGGTTNSTCRQCNANGDCTNNNDGPTRTRTNDPTTISYRVQGWEDDTADRCTSTSGDDCFGDATCSVNITTTLDNVWRDATCSVGGDHNIVITWRSRYATVNQPSAFTFTSVGCDNNRLNAISSNQSNVTWYWQGTNSAGTSTGSPSTANYAISAPGTYYLRARGDRNGAWSTSASLSVTAAQLRITPAAVSASGGGNFCPGTTVNITASGGAGGTIYYQGTTSNGTSTATPSTSVPITTAGTYYFRSADTSPGGPICWGAQGSVTVTFNDAVAPTISCPSNISVNATAGTCGAVVTYTTPVGADNCPGATTTRTAGFASGATFPVGTTTVTHQVTNNGSTASCSFTVTVIDNQAPTISCPANISVNATAGQCGAIVNYTTPVGTDNCPGASTARTAGLASGATFPVGITTVTHVVTAANGATATCSFTVTVTDNQAPTISCPANITVDATTGQCGTIVNYTTPVGVDNCPGAGTARTAGLASGATFPVGTTTVTHVVTAANGATASCSFTVTVVDNQLPTIVCPSNITVNAAPGACIATVTYSTPVGLDNCPGASTTLIAGLASGASFPLGLTTVTYQVTAANGAIATCSFSVTVLDNQAASIVCPPNLTVATNSGCTATGVGLGLPSSNDNCSIASTSNNAPSIFPLGATTVTWTVTDGSGNVTTCNQIVTVVDNTNPTISCPAAVVVSANASCNATGVSLGTPVTGDNCSVASVTNNAPGTFPLGNTTVTWTVTDGSGNIATCTQLVTVVDDTNPVITCPAAVSVSANASCGATGVSLGTPITSDNCSVASVTNDAPGTFPLGNTTVTWTVTDGSGNTFTCTQIVTVVDDTNPTILCPSTVSVSTNSGCTAIGVSLGAPVTSDNCSVASVTNDEPGVYPLGNTTVTWTVTDGSGNTATCTQTVTVEDNTNPTAICQSITVQLDANGDASITAAQIDNGSNDACGIASLSLDVTSFDCSNIGANPVILTVTDNYGNVSTCSATVTIEDNVAPVAICQSITVQLDANGNASITTADINNGSNDACGIASLSLDITSFDCSNVGANTVVLTVTDNNGNVSTCPATVTVEDNVAPVAICQSITVQLDASGNASITTADIDNGSNDACGIADLSLDITSFDCSNIGDNPVVLTVTDNNGNVSSCPATVTVEDNIAPIAICQSITVQLDASGNASITTADIDNGSNDACGIADLSLDISSFDCSNIGDNPVVLTVTDNNGNVSTCPATVTVEDNVAPVAICQSITVQLDASGNASITTADINNGSNDACGIASLSLDITSFDCSDVGANTVVLTVTDNNGNVSTCTATVTVEDNIAPTIGGGCLPDIATTNSILNCNQLVSWVHPINSDNCGIQSAAFTAPGVFITDFGFGGVFGLFSVGTTVVTYTVTDVNGNVTTCTFDVVVADVENPTITGCPADIIIGTDAGNCSAQVFWNVPTASDNCPGVSMTVNNHFSGQTYPIGTTTVIYTATDNVGLQTVCSFDIIVTDDENPTITCPSNVSVTADAGLCSASGVALGNPITDDNCPGETVSNNAPLTYPLGNTTVVWTVTDAAGNTATCNQTVTVTDDENPTIACPADVSVSTDNGVCSASGVALGSPVTGDNCPGESVSNNAPSVFPLGNTTVIWTVTDGSGNTATCTQLVTVTDDEDPIIACPANITQSTDATLCTAVVTYSVTGSDNCVGEVISQTAGLASGSAFPIGTTTNSFLITDGSGNTATCSFDVTIEDTEAPVAICQDLTLQLDANGAVSIAAADVNNGSYDNCGSIATSISTQTAINYSSIDNNLIVSDLSTDLLIFTPTTTAFLTSIELYDPNGGNTGSVSILNDTPCNGGASLGTTNSVTTALGWNTYSFASPLTVTAGNTYYFVTGSGTVVGNGSSDDNAAFGTLTYDSGLNTCNAATNEYDTKVNTYIAPQQSTLNFNCADLGSNTVTLTVVDASGNQSTCTSTITIEDNIAPVATCPADVAVNTSPGLCEAIAVNLGIPTVVDNCAGYVITNDAPINFPIGTTTVNWTVTDIGGNTATCTQTVTVTDAENPVINCPANITQNTDAGDCGAVVTFAVTSSDNCPGESINQTAGLASGSTYPLGTTTNTFVVTDAAGNTSTCSFNVTIVDNEAPVAICQDITVQLDASGNASITAADINNGSNDACGIASISADITSFTCADLVAGSSTVSELFISEYIEGSGNNKCIEIYNGTGAPVNLGTGGYNIQLFFNGSTSAGTTINLTGTVNDGDVFVLCNSSATGAFTSLADQINGGLSYNGDDAIVLRKNTTRIDVFGRVGEDPGAYWGTPLGLNTLDKTLIRNDNVSSGNIDNLVGFPSLTTEWSALSTDNTSNLGAHSLDVGVAGQKEVTLTVTDNNGNTSTCTATVTIEDNVAPVALCQNITVQLDASGNVSIDADDIDNGSNDACGIDTISIDVTSFDCSNIGANTVVLTVVDVNGNTSTCNATVTVEDNVAPVALCQDITVQLDVTGNATITAADIDNGSSDACGIASLAIDNSSFDCSDVSSASASADLFISEYIEGSGNNKCIEIYNGTGAAVNLATNNYRLLVYFNGSNTAATNIALTGTVADGDVYVICNSSATSAFTSQADATSGSLSYNGDDAVVLTKNSVAVDVFGRIGQDPGLSWTVSGNTTVDQTLVRNSTVTDGNTANLNGFPSLGTEWTALAQDNSSNLGSHSTGGGGVEVTLTVTDNNGNVSTCTATVTVEDNVAPEALCQSITVQLDASGNASITTADIDNGSNDACGIASLSLSKSTFNCSNVGANTVVLTVTDNNGNVSTCSATVTVEDNVAPVALCQSITVQLDASGNASITTADIDNGSNDACGIASLALDVTSFDCSNVGANPVVLTVTDNNGNVSTCSATVTIEDNVAPIALCQSITVQLDASGNASITTADIDNGSSDACGIASLALDVTTFDCSNVGGNPVVLTVTDNNGNVSTCSATVTIEDNVAPVALCQSITVQLDASGNASITTADIDNGSNDACGIASLALDVTSFDCSNVGANAVVLTVTDNNGNVSTCSATVTVEDNVAPVVLCQSITVQLDASGNASITTADIDNGSSDACGIASLALDVTSFDCSNVGANPVVLTVTDNNGNVSSCSATVTIEDNVAPVALCQSITVQLDASGNASITTADIDNGSSDACGIASLALDVTSFDCSNVGGNPVVLTVTDNNGNVSTCSATVTVEDNVAPVALCQSITVQLDASGNANITTGDIDNGSNDACGIASLALDVTSFDCSNVGANPVVLTVTDNNGNVSTCSATATVEDNVAPIALCESITIELDINGNAAITPADIDAGSNDACGIASLALDITTFDCSNVGDNPVVLTVTDNNGNVSTCSATVTVEDNIAPEALCQNITIQLDASGNASILAESLDNGSTDNCSGTSSSNSVLPWINEVTYTDLVIMKDLSYEVIYDGSLDLDAYEIKVFKGTIGGTLVEYASNTLTQLDGASISLGGGLKLSTYMLGALTGADAPLAIGLFNGTTPLEIISWTGLDPSTVLLSTGDNSDYDALFTEGVTNTSNGFDVALERCGGNSPAITNWATGFSPHDLPVMLSNSLGSVNGCQTLDFSGGVTSNLVFTVNKSKFNCTNVGSNTVVLTVTDANGNATTCNAVVSVEDNVEPVALCQAITVQLDASGNVSITPEEIDNGSYDACGIASLALDVTSFDCSNVGDNTVVLTVTDVNGNVSTCSATVTVEDIVAPVALCQSITVQLDASGNVSITPADIDNGSNDACGIASLALDVAAFNCSNIGANPVVLTVTDNNGNVSTCSATVTVEDNVAPVALCQAITVQLDASGNASITTADIDNGSNDACGIAGLALDITSFDCSNVGANTVVLTVTDNNGNVSTCSATVTVEDNVAPVALCQSITVQLDASGNASFTTADIDNGSNDACGIASLALDVDAFDCSNVGANAVVLTVTDNNGNVSTCSATVTVEDNVAPVALCQSITVQLDASGNASITTADIDNGSNDACGIASLALDVTSFDCSNVGANTVVLTVTDNNGNVSTCSSTVTVEDNVAPVALCQSITLQLDASGNASITTADIDNGSNDACGIASLALDVTSFDCSNVGANTVVLTVTDNNGNVSTCSATVTVEDNVAPVALCQSITVQLDASGNASITTADIDNGSNDACGIASLALDITSFDCSNVGANTVVLTVTDNNGNVSTCSATVTVEDNVAPIAICQNITIFLNSSGVASIIPSDIDNGSNDACGIASLELDVTSFDCSNVGANTVVLTVTDNNGNVSTCSATVTVQDLIEPVAICKDITVQLDAAGNVTITPADVDNGSNDACGIADLSIDVAAFDCSNVGANTVVLTVTDNNGNVSTCTSTVTVEDNVAPVAICQNITIQLDAAGHAEITTADIDNGSNDACGIASLSLDKTNFDCSDAGPNTVTLTVTDNNGNVSTCIAMVEVEDNVAPIAICENITVVLDANGNAVVTPEDIDNGSNDACGIASLALDITSFDCSNIGANPVVLTVTDNNGNVTTCSAVVNVEGIIPTLLITSDILPDLCQGGTLTLTANSPEAVAYSWSTGATTESIQINANGVYTATVTSATGCTSTASYTVTGFNATELLSSYTIIATDGDVHLHGNNTVTAGGVGVMKYNKEAKLHVNTIVNGFVKADDVDISGGSSAGSIIYAQADPVLPPFIANPYGNNIVQDITVNTNSVVTLNNCIYDKLTIKKNAVVTFTCNNIYIRELKVEENVTINFTGSANMYISKNVDLDKSHKFNLAGHTVNMYIDGHLKVGEKSNVKASVYALKHIDVDGKKGTTYMTGLFIGEKVDGHDNVVWNWNTNCNPAPIPDDLLADDDDDDDDDHGHHDDDDDDDNHGHYHGHDHHHGNGHGHGHHDDDDDDDDNHRVVNPAIVSEVYPNPFSDKATIAFTLGEKNPTVVEVVSLSGVRVELKDLGELEALIEHTVEFTPNASMSSGTYIYRIISGNNVSTGRMIFIR